MGTGSARLGIWRRPLGPSTGALHRQLDQSRAEPRPPGWVRKFEGTEQEAALHWPAGTAIGKLNLVLAEGKEPRIVLDSSVCGLNPAVHLPERVALPTGADVQRSFLSDDCFAQLCAVSLDFKAAHKCCKVLPKDQGTLLFRHRNALYHYTVCHFGARFSAYWWQRTGSLMLRCLPCTHCSASTSTAPGCTWVTCSCFCACQNRKQALRSRSHCWAPLMLLSVGKKHSSRSRSFGAVGNFASHRNRWSSWQTSF